MSTVEQKAITPDVAGEPSDGNSPDSHATNGSPAQGDQPQADAEESGGGNIDKIRDILFGTQMRDTDKRFSRLEERLLKESSELRDETTKRFDALELYIKREMEALTERLTTEQNVRRDSVQELSQDLKDIFKAFEKKTAQLEEQATRSTRELREQILDQSKSLNEEIRKKYLELFAALERESKELRSEKMDRKALSTMFTEFSMRLTNEFKVPDAE